MMIQKYENIISVLYSKCQQMISVIFVAVWFSVVFRVCCDPSKYKTIIYHLYNAGQTFSTLVQHCTNTLQMFCVYWDGSRAGTLHQLTVYFRPHLISYIACNKCSGAYRPTSFIFPEADTHTLLWMIVLTSGRDVGQGTWWCMYNDDVWSESNLQTNTK